MAQSNELLTSSCGIVLLCSRIPPAVSCNLYQGHMPLKASRTINNEQRARRHRKMTNPNQARRWYHWYAPSDSPQERKLILKLDLLIVPYAFLVYWVKYIDQSNISRPTPHPILLLFRLQYGPRQRIRFWLEGGVGIQWQSARTLADHLHPWGCFGPNSFRLSLHESPHALAHTWVGLWMGHLHLASIQGPELFGIDGVPVHGGIV
jgi:hypothetical protein